MKEIHMSREAFNEMEKQPGCGGDGYINPYIPYHLGITVHVSPFLPFKRIIPLPKNKLKRAWRWFRVRVLRREELHEMVHCIGMEKRSFNPNYGTVVSTIYHPIGIKTGIF